MPTVEQFNAMMNQLSQMNMHLKKIAELTWHTNQALKEMKTAGNESAGGQGKAAPNYHKLLSDYPAYDWASIGAEVIDSDKDGATTVSWKGRMFTRRRGNADYDPVVYFSRCTGKEGEKNIYEWLITFKEPPKAKRLPEETKEVMEQAAEKRASKPPVNAQQSAVKRSPGLISTEEPELKCSLSSWDKLTKAVDAAAKWGVTPDKWKPKVKNMLGSEDMRAMGDADIAKAVNIINGLAETARLAAPNRMKPEVQNA